MKGPHGDIRGWIREPARPKYKRKIIVCADCGNPRPEGQTWTRRCPYCSRMLRKDYQRARYERQAAEKRGERA